MWETTAAALCFPRPPPPPGHSWWALCAAFAIQLCNELDFLGFKKEKKGVRRDERKKNTILSLGREIRAGPSLPPTQHVSALLMPASAGGGRPAATKARHAPKRAASPPSPDADDPNLTAAPPAEGGAAFHALMAGFKRTARKKARAGPVARGGIAAAAPVRGPATPAGAPAPRQGINEATMSPTRAEGAGAGPAPAPRRRGHLPSPPPDDTPTAPDPSDAFLGAQLAADAVASLDAGGDRLAPDSGAPVAPQWGPRARWLVAGAPLPRPPASLAEAGVRPRVVAHWHEVRARDGVDQAGGGGDDTPPSLSLLPTASASALFTALRSYKDVLYTARTPPTHRASPVGGRDADGDALLLHIAAHIAAAATRVRRGNEREKAVRDGGAAADDDTPRDQGFARAKVLLLLPLRSTAHAATLRLAALLQRETRADSVQGKARFEDEYGPGSDGEEEGEEAGGERGGRGSRLPPDAAALFSGNSDDHFRFGIRVTRGAVKLYADFTDADIIVASPLGVVTYLEGGGPAAADALTGIELIALDRADVAARQNWAHVLTVLDAVNRLPTAVAPGLNIMRVRESALAGWSRATRQLILTTAYPTPPLVAAFAAAARSHAGRARLDVAPEGVLASAPPLVQLAFERVPGDEADDPTATADARACHFAAVVWPRLATAGASGILIFVPSYFDYVRVKKHFKSVNEPIADMGEYIAPRDAARARTRFREGAPRVALLTEWSHFYHRSVVRGVSHALFYGVPDDPRFYSDVVSWVGARGRAVGDAPAGGRATTLFTRLDALALERVVGRDRAKRMVKGDEAVYVFC